ncbi:MAG TPA: sigma-70 family RNA polymerase sigma factor [Bacilli bacterium]|jgi:RNA polymerase sigma factor (sigma-70 family)|nr:sigma-70 family RNA polymerase sigma factor [Bacilli bacterium]
MDLPDNDLANMVSENNEEARDELYEKYKYIVDIIINKYKTSAYYLSVDMNELRQEALVGFSDALVNYNQDKESSLPTFITLCVERRVNNYVKKNDTIKMKMLHQALSLDSKVNDESDFTYMDMIGNQKGNPEIEMEDKENVEILNKKINESLSPQEKEVYQLLINNFSYDDIAAITKKTIPQVYNIVYHIRQKIRDIIS